MWFSTAYEGGTGCFAEVKMYLCGVDPVKIRNVWLDSAALC